MSLSSVGTEVTRTKTLQTRIGEIHINNLVRYRNKELYKITLGTEALSVVQRENEGGLDGLVKRILCALEDPEMADLQSIHAAYIQGSYCKLRG